MRRATEQSCQERLLALLAHIEAHLDEPLPLAELASIACLSPHHFHRVFHGMVGEPVAEHVRRLRLEQAARQFRKGRRPVTEVALDAGYDAPAAFTRAFRAMFRQPPSAYRRAPLPGGAPPGSEDAAAGKSLRSGTAKKGETAMPAYLADIGISYLAYAIILAGLAAARFNPRSAAASPAGAPYEAP